MGVKVKKEKKSKSMGLNYIALDQVVQAEHGKTKKKSKKKKAKEFSNSPGVVFLKHIPYGFFEPQMRKYFEQFGRITRLRLARSKKTGKSKGYAYIEFAHQEVAKLVAETMNNYLMFTRILKCDFVPYEDLHDKAFVGCHRLFQKPKSRKMAILRYNRRAAALANTVEKRSTTKKQKLAQALELLGLKYDTSNLSGNPDFVPPPRKCSKLSKKDTMEAEEGKTEDTKTEDVVDEKTNEDEKSPSDCDNSTSDDEEDVVDEKTNEDEKSPSDGENSTPVDEEGEDANNTSTISSASDYDDKNCLIVDQDDPEITFKVPPFCKKVISLEEHVERQKKRSKRKRKQQMKALEKE